MMLTCSHSGFASASSSVWRHVVKWNLFVCDGQSGLSSSVVFGIASKWLGLRSARPRQIDFLIWIGNWYKFPVKLKAFRKGIRQSANDNLNWNPPFAALLRESCIAQYSQLADHTGLAGARPVRPGARHPAVRSLSLQRGELSYIDMEQRLFLRRARPSICPSSLHL